MDPVTAAVLGALLTHAGQTVGDAIGGAATKLVGEVWARVRDWWSDDPVASEQLVRFEQDPGQETAGLARVLERKASDDRSTIEAIAETLRDAQGGNLIEVFQDVGRAGTVLGAHIGRLKAHDLRVVQKVDEATDVTGLRIDGA